MLQWATVWTQFREKKNYPVFFRFSSPHWVWYCIDRKMRFKRSSQPSCELLSKNVLRSTYLCRICFHTILLPLLICKWEILHIITLAGMHLHSYRYTKECGDLSLENSQHRAPGDPLHAGFCSSLTECHCIEVQIALALPCSRVFNFHCVTEPTVSIAQVCWGFESVWDVLRVMSLGSLELPWLWLWGLCLICGCLNVIFDFYSEVRATLFLCAGI